MVKTNCQFRKEKRFNWVFTKQATKQKSKQKASKKASKELIGNRAELKRRAAKEASFTSHWEALLLYFREEFFFRTLGTRLPLHRPTWTTHSTISFSMLFTALKEAVFSSCLTAALIKVSLPWRLIERGAQRSDMPCSVV